MKNATYKNQLQKRKPAIRADFDHFVRRNKRNELSVNNLVPCCPVCNSRLKGDKYITSQTHIHPFKDDFDKIAEFCIDISSFDYLDEHNFSIKIKERENTTKELWNKAKNNIELLALEDRYNFHKDVVVDIFRDIKYYYDEKLNEIDELINSNEPTYKHLENYKNVEINQVSLGKLKKDITIKYTK